MFTCSFSSKTNRCRPHKLKHFLVDTTSQMKKKKRIKFPFSSHISLATILLVRYFVSLVYLFPCIFIKSCIFIEEGVNEMSGKCKRNISEINTKELHGKKETSGKLKLCINNIFSAEIENNKLLRLLLYNKILCKHASILSSQLYCSLKYQNTNNKYHYENDGKMWVKWIECKVIAQIENYLNILWIRY